MGLAKLAWWQEELRGWAKGARRHPLGVRLQKAAVDWNAVADALPALARREEIGDGQALSSLARTPVSYTHLDVYKRQVGQHAGLETALGQVGQCIDRIVDAAQQHGLVEQYRAGIAQAAQRRIDLPDELVGVVGVDDEGCLLYTSRCV